MDKSKILFVGAIVIVVLLLYLNKNKSTKSADEEEADNAFSNISDKLTSGIGTITSASSVSKTVEDEEYQNLLIEYKRLNGGILPPGATSLTTAQLQSAVKSLEKLNNAINQYYEIESDDVQLSAEQLAEKGIDTVEEIQSLINETKARQKKEYLTGLCTKFITTCNNFGDIWNPAGAKSWDTSILNEIMTLSLSDTQQLNRIFRDRAECKYPENFSAGQKYWTVRTSLSNAIPTGTLNTYRKGASTAKAFKQEMLNRNC